MQDSVLNIYMYLIYFSQGDRSLLLSPFHSWENWAWKDKVASSGWHRKGQGVWFQHILNFSAVSSPLWACAQPLSECSLLSPPLLVEVLKWWVVLMNLVLLFSLSLLGLLWDTCEAEHPHIHWWRSKNLPPVNYIQVLGLWRKSPQLHTGFLYKECKCSILSLCVWVEIENGQETLHVFPFQRYQRITELVCTV